MKSFLNPYYVDHHHSFQFTRQQASHFAKKIAGDFNPIHDEDSKRFCVPGDLLFAVMLQKQGVSKTMKFQFSNMVNEETMLTIQHQDAENCSLIDPAGTAYLHMQRQGEINQDPDFIQHLVTNYVQFSGMNFPHIMVPLMQEKQMMINAQRPLVIYQSMEVHFEHLTLIQPSITLNTATFDVEGKRGVVTLHFDFEENNEVVGQGIKRLLTSGLKPYQQTDIDELVARFNHCKTQFLTLHSVA